MSQAQHAHSNPTDDATHLKRQKKIIKCGNKNSVEMMMADWEKN